MRNKYVDKTLHKNEWQTITWWRHLANGFTFVLECRDDQCLCFFLIMKLGYKWKRNNSLRNMLTI